MKLITEIECLRCRYAPQAKIFYISTIFMHFQGNFFHLSLFGEGGLPPEMQLQKLAGLPSPGAMPDSWRITIVTLALALPNKCHILIKSRVIEYRNRKIEKNSYIPNWSLLENTWQLPRIVISKRHRFECGSLHHSSFFIIAIELQWWSF